MKRSSGTLVGGSLGVIKGSSFVNSRDLDRSRRFFIEILQTDVIQEGFNV
jgi:hypothetical protein